MSSPNAAPYELAGNRAARDVNIPDVPELRSGRLSAMLIVDRCGSRLFCFSGVGRRPPHVAAASHRTRGKPKRQARAAEGQRTAARDCRDESLL